MRITNCLPFRSTWVHPRVLLIIFRFALFVLSYYVIMFFSSVLWYPLQFAGKNDVRLGLTLFCSVWGHVLFMLFVFIYSYWCQTGFPYQMMFVWRNSNTSNVTFLEQELLLLLENQIFSGIRFARSLFVCVVFGRSLFVLFPLTIVLSVPLRFTLLITLLVSSNSSYLKIYLFLTVKLQLSDHKKIESYKNIKCSHLKIQAFKVRKRWI